MKSKQKHLVLRIVAEGRCNVWIYVYFLFFLRILRRNYFIFIVTIII